jgi:glutamyl-tRNA reductase
MPETFKLVGLSFKQTPIEIREKLTLNEDECKRVMQFIRDYSSAEEALVLSTCNRTEIYYSSEKVLTETIIKGIASIKGLASENISGFFNEVNESQDAVNYLFRVSMGLEAQVVGDIQISNQVKRAYQWSADLNMAGPFLHRLMHTIFFTNKRVVQETPYRDGAASISYAAKELIEDISAEIADPSILVLGLGEIGQDVCKNLQNAYKSVTIVNRTREKAEMVAAECGFQVADFSNVIEEIRKADVIISSISMKAPFITREMVESMELVKFKFFIDLSVPRSVDLHIEEIPGALVYNIDHITSKVSEALNKRMAAIPDVERIIQESIDEFENWSKEMTVSPTIKKIKNALEDIRQQEIERYLRNATPAEADLIDKATKGMMQKIMKLPVLQLKAACQRGDAENLIDVLTELFDLEKESKKA